MRLPLFILSTTCVIFWVALNVVTGLAAEPGLKFSVNADLAQASMDDDDKQLIILDRKFLRVIDVESERVISTFEHKGDLIHRTRGLSRNGEFFGFERNVDPAKFVICRVSDQAVIAELPRYDRRSEETSLWGTQTEIADDGSFIVTVVPGRGTEIIRVDCGQDVKITRSQTIRTADELYDCGFAGGEPGALAVVAHKKIRRRDVFRVHLLDHYLRERSSVELPGWKWAGILDVSDPSNPLIAVGGELKWAVFRPEGKEILCRAFGSHSPQPLRGFEGVRSGAISPDGRWIVTALWSQMPTIGVWSLYDGVKLLEREVSQPVQMIRFSRSGKYLVLCDDRKVALYNFQQFATPASEVSRAK